MFYFLICFYFIYFILNPKNSLAVGLRCSIDMEMEETIEMNKTINLTGSSIEFYKFFLKKNKKTKKINILDEFQVSVLIHTYNNVSQKIFINSDKMNFTFAKQDYLLIQILQQRWETVMKERPLEIAPNETSNTSEIASTLIDEYPDFITSIDVLVDGISLKLVDDFKGKSVPLLTLNLSKAKTIVMMTSEVLGFLNVSVETHLSADFFNINNHSWEPVLR